MSAKRVQFFKALFGAVVTFDPMFGRNRVSSSHWTACVSRFLKQALPASFYTLFKRFVGWFPSPERLAGVEPATVRFAV